MVLAIGLVAFVAGLVDFGDCGSGQIGVLVFDGFECFFGGGEHCGGKLGVGFIVGIGHSFELKDLAVGGDQFGVFGDFVEVVGKVVFVARMGSEVLAQSPFEDLHGGAAVCGIGPRGFFGRAVEFGSFEKVLKVLLPEFGFVVDRLRSDFGVCCDASKGGTGVGCGGFPADLLGVLSDDPHQRSEQGEFAASIAVAAACEFRRGGDDPIDSGFGFFDEVLDRRAADELLPDIVSLGRRFGLARIVAGGHRRVRRGCLGSGPERRLALELGAGIGEKDAGEFIRLELRWFGSIGFTDGLLGKRVGPCERHDRQAEQESASEGGLRHGPARCGKGSLASRWPASNFWSIVS